MRPHLAPALLAGLAPALSAQHVPTVDVANLGVQSNTVLAGPAFAALLVAEDSQGTGLPGDLNGDGDLFDRVLHVYDSRTGALVNLGFAVGAEATSQPYQHFALSERYLVFRVDEAAQGQTAFDGDDTATERVAHVYDHATGLVTNLALPARGAWVGDGWALLDVDEAEHETDLDGDGATTHRVLVAYELATGAVQSTGVALGAGPPIVHAYGDFVAFTASESANGGQDVNGNGWSDDFLAVRDLAAGQDQVVPYARGDEFLMNERFVAHPVLEALAPVAWGDLNGDGDTTDHVIGVFDLQTGTHALVAAGGLLLAGPAIARGPRLYFFVNENQQGATDFNGDGDAFDFVLHAFDLDTQVLTNHGRGAIAMNAPLHTENLIYLHLREFDEGADLNGDGDLDDSVPTAYDLVSGAGVSFGHSVGPFPFHAGDGDGHAVGVWETAEQADLNSDGDQTDILIYRYDHGSGALEGPLVNAASNGLPFTLQHGNLVTSRAEGPAPENGDGDTLDAAVVLLDTTTGALYETGLWESNLFASGDSYLLARVPEAEMFGADLDGNGSAQDSVWHAVRYALSRGLVADTTTLSLSSGGTQTFAVDAGAEHAGRPYWILGSASGLGQGLALGSWSFTPVLDGFFAYETQNPGQLVAGALGWLDAEGRAEASLSLPAGLDPALAGARFEHACAVLDVGGVPEVAVISNPFPTRLAP